MKRGAFTLVELLVCLVILGVLSALILAAVQHARGAAQLSACLHNLKQIGVGIYAYAGDNEGKIPYGPAAGAYTNAGSFYPSTGAPTSLISLQSGQPVALGLLLDKYLSHQPEVLFCPGAGGALDARSELAKVGQEQAQSSYYYRHGGNTELFDSPLGPPSEPPLRIGGLGENRKGKPIRALVLDTIFICPPELKDFNVYPVRNHGGATANVLYTDGHVGSLSNVNGRYSVDVSSHADVRKAFKKILEVFEKADAE